MRFRLFSHLLVPHVNLSFSALFHYAKRKRCMKLSAFICIDRLIIVWRNAFNTKKNLYFWDDLTLFIAFFYSILLLEFFTLSLLTIWFEPIQFKSPQIINGIPIKINQFLLEVMQIQIRAEIVHIVPCILLKFIQIVN